MIKRRSRKRWSCTGLEFIADSMRVSPPCEGGVRGGGPGGTLAWYAVPQSLAPAENTASDEAAGYALPTPPDPPFARGGKGGLARAAIAVIGFALALTMHGATGSGSVLWPRLFGPKPEYRGLYGRRQGITCRQAELDRDRRRGFRIVRVDRRCHREVPRCQAPAARGIHRLEARGRHRGGARPAGRPEGAESKQLLLGRRHAQSAQQDRGAALAKTHRQGVQPPQDGRGGLDAIDRQTSRCRTGRRRESRAAERLQQLLLLSLEPAITGVGPIRAR